jgi:hypothetical protein
MTTQMYEDPRDIRGANFAPGDEAVVAGEEFVDYFGFGRDEVFALPDGKQEIFFKVMNEGQRAQFQKRTSKDIKFNRASGDAAIKADQAEERHELILSSVTGWSLRRRGPQGWDVVPFSTGGANSALAQWLKVADPKIVDDLELAIRRANPWMQADMSVEEIDKEIERLQDLRKEVEARELGK